MRRSAAAAAITVAVAGIVATVALAKSSAQVKVPAPAIGKSSAYLVTVKVTGAKPGRPSLQVTNLAALGKGFGAVAATEGPKKPGRSATYKVYVLMFMGNLSTSPAGTVNLQVTPPAGDTADVSKPENETKNCPVLRPLDHMDNVDASNTILRILDHSGSTAKGFISGVVPSLCR